MTAVDTGSDTYAVIVSSSRAPINRLVPSKSSAGFFPMIAAPFRSAKLKVKRADKHIREVEGLIDQFLRENLHKYTTGLNQDSETGEYAVKLTMPIPSLSGIESPNIAVGDAIHNLRTALDHVAFEILKPFGIDPQSIYFPIDKNRQSLITQPHFRKIESLAPDLANIIADFVGPNGSSFIGLNQLDRTDKHRPIITTVVRSQFSIFPIENEDSIPVEAAGHFVVPIGNKIITAGSAADLHNKNNCKPPVEICFGPGEPFDNRSILPTLIQLMQLVSGLIETLEAHLQGRNPGR
jgi:hypothetical protein